MRVLPMDVEEEFTGFAQLRDRRRMAVDERAAAAASIERAPQQQHARITAQRMLIKPRRERPAGRGIEFRCDFRTLRAVADHRRVGAAAHSELERVHQDRLARAGLAGEHREPRLELELERLDDDKIADAQLAEHGVLVSFYRFTPTQLLAQHLEIAVSGRMDEADRVARALQAQPVALGEVGQRLAVEMRARVA